MCIYPIYISSYLFNLSIYLIYLPLFIQGVEGFGQTILTPAAKKQGTAAPMDTIILQAGDKLPSIIQVDSIILSHYHSE